MEGLYTEGSSKYDGETKLGIYFGDSTCMVMVIGVCKTADTEGKKEIRNEIQSLDDIFKFSDQLIKILEGFEVQKKPV